MEKEKLMEYMRKAVACHNENHTDCLGRDCCDCPHDYPVETIELIESALELLEEGETQEKPFPFVVGQPAEMFFDGKWVKGKIVAGYRFNDGVVTIETEDGRRLWCGQDRTDIYRPYQEDEA